MKKRKTFVINVYLVLFILFLLISPTKRSAHLLFGSEKKVEKIKDLNVKNSEDKTSSKPPTKSGIRIFRGLGKDSIYLYAESLNSNPLFKGKKKIKKLTRAFATKRANFLNPSVTDLELQYLLKSNKLKILDIHEATALTDSSFIKNKTLKTLRLRGMTKLSDQALKNFQALEFLGLENTPQITFAGVLSLKSLKRLWLWNTPHFSEKHLALLREKGIRVWDGRFKKSKNYSLPHFE